MGFVQNHWKTVTAALVVLVVYLYLTRTTTIGTVDVSGSGMTINGVPS